MAKVDARDGSWSKAMIDTSGMLLFRCDLDICKASEREEIGEIWFGYIIGFPFGSGGAVARRGGVVADKDSLF